MRMEQGGEGTVNISQHCCYLEKKLFFIFAGGTGVGGGGGGNSP